MNPNPSVAHAPPEVRTRKRPAYCVGAIVRAICPDVFGVEALPSLPRWVPLAAGAALLMAGVLSLIGTLRGGF